MLEHCLCGNANVSKSRRIDGIGGVSEIVQCVSCKTYRWKLPAIAEEKDIRTEYVPGGKNYFETNKAHEQNYVVETQSLHTLTLARRIANLSSGPIKLLDCGCGLGQLLGAIRALRPDWNLSGVEINPSYVSFVRKKGFGVHEGTIEELLPRLETYDLIVMTEVLEHLEKPLAALCLLRKRLAPSGSLVLTVPNLNSVVDHFILRGRSALSIPFQHLWFFTGQTLTKLVQNAGFVVQECRTVSFFGAKGHSLRSMIAMCLNPVLNLTLLGGTLLLVAKQKQ